MYHGFDHRGLFRLPPPEINQVPVGRETVDHADQIGKRQGKNEVVFKHEDNFLPTVFSNTGMSLKQGQSKIELSP
jgi:hypothetical protein